jgi:ATP-dependent protease ClpP protease subunit
MSDEIEDVVYNSTDDKDEIVYKTQVVLNKYYLHLDEDIVEPSHYRPMYITLREAQEEDIIHFIINTNGGDVNTFIQLFNGILQTKAFVIADVICASSAGSLIALSCDQIIINKFSSMFIHSLSASSVGKSEEIRAQSDFLNKWNEKIIREIYCDFLTPIEINKVIEGKDFWFLEEEISDRLKNWKPIRQKLIEEYKKTENKNIRKKKK